MTEVNYFEAGNLVENQICNLSLEVLDTELPHSARTSLLPFLAGNLALHVTRPLPPGTDVQILRRLKASRMERTPGQHLGSLLLKPPRLAESP